MTKVNIGDAPHNLLHVGFHFYILGVSRSDAIGLSKYTNGTLKAVMQNKHCDMNYNLVAELESPKVADRLAKQLQRANVSSVRGVAIVLHSDNSMNGITVPQYIMDFYRRVGGSFSVSIRIV